MANNARRSRSLTFRVLFLASLWAALALIAIAIAGLLLLATPLLLPRHDRTPRLKNADQAPPERQALA